MRLEFLLVTKLVFQLTMRLPFLLDTKLVFLLNMRLLSILSDLLYRYSKAPPCCRSQTLVGRRFNTDAETPTNGSNDWCTVCTAWP